MKLAILVAAAMACTTPVLAQGGGGGSAGGAGGNRASGPSSSQSGNENQGTTGNSGATAIRNAETGANTKPTSPSSRTVSAPGVGVGHAANGQPIGTPGSGPGSPEQPIDGKHLEGSR
jgi:hypothetical protein